MIKAFQHLHAWLMEHDIEPRGFKVVIQSDKVTAERISFELGRDWSSMKLHPDPPQVKEGLICGLRFSIETQTHE
jgi:hypothetical protein